MKELAAEEEEMKRQLIFDAKVKQNVKFLAGQLIRMDGSKAFAFNFLTCIRFEPVGSA